MLQETKIKGLTTELQCQISFTQLGYNVSVPLSEDCRYDFIADIEGKLLRVQVKTCREENNGIVFNTRSTHLSAQGSVQHSYSEEDIDVFATYYNNQCYLIPVGQCGISSKKLLFKKNSCNQTGDLLSDYTLLKTLSKISYDEREHYDEREQKENLNKILFKKEVIKIKQYSLNGEYLNTYSSYADASRAINVERGGSHISEAANGKRKTSYGFVWKVEKEEE